MREDYINWTGGFSGTSKYGIAAFEGRTTSAHRVAYCKEHGLSLSDIKGLQVCHACDNPKCVNPEHLWLGTRKQNMQDCIAKGRFSRGASHSQALAARDFRYDAEHSRRTRAGCKKGPDSAKAKLSAADVRELRAAWGRREASQKILAARFGVSQAAVSLIVNRLTYKEVR